MASETRSPSTPGTKSWELAKIRPRKQLARIMLGRRISTVGDLGGSTESLKQKKSVSWESEIFTKPPTRGTISHLSDIFHKISSRISNYLQMAFQTLSPFREAVRQNVTKQTKNVKKCHICRKCGLLSQNPQVSQNTN